MRGVIFRAVGEGNALASGTQRFIFFLLLALTALAFSFILIPVGRCRRRRRRSSDISDEKFRLYCWYYWIGYPRAGNARRDCHVNGGGGGGSSGGVGRGGGGSLGGRRGRQSRVQ